MALSISSFDIWSSSAVSWSRWRTWVSACGEVFVFLLLRSFSQCGPNSVMFSLSFFALLLFRSWSAML